jgi:hypothetical protein
VGSCDVLIAVIGKRWLTSSEGEGNRRLDNPDDFVRLEVATALKRNIRVIPVLVDGASMPPARDLPDDLKSLVRRNAVEVSHTRFSADSERLIAALERVFEKTAAEQREREEKARLEEQRREREENERLEAERREVEKNARLEAERRQREKSDWKLNRGKGTPGGRTTSARRKGTAGARTRVGASQPSCAVDTPCAT